MASTPCQKSELSSFIKNWALGNGFLECGISPAGELKSEKARLEQWLKEGRHAEMSYMEENFEKRCDPSLLLDKAKSVISFLYNYYPEQKLSQEQHYKISKYAYGRDYHKVIKKKLKPLVQLLVQNHGAENTRAFIDSAPVMDKVWAAKSGLGWIGKNTCLISRKHGSFFFVAEIITDLELEYETEIQKDLCGSCSRCIRACPTGALTDPYQIDAPKCISYQSIENKAGDLPSELKGKFENWIFGCDICQDVCPWNRISKPTNESDFRPSGDLKKMEKIDWEKLDEEKFDHLFFGSAVKRTKFEGLKRNIKFVQDQGD
jgi:epoxyqueuosine reductase